MIRTILGYGATIAVAGFVLRWLETRHALRLFATDTYVILIAILFTALGIGVGSRLAGRRSTTTFERDERAIESLGISEREYEVLELLARGLSNREIADRLFVSPNTVKTHLKNLYAKLDVSRRTQAVHRAKGLRIIR